VGSGRIILHSDLNSFYASVEMALNPSLRGKAVAVCGSTEDRHGIVLAKSEPAKNAGVKTGMVNWEARQKCPDLIMISPRYEQYLRYSKLTVEIYKRFTDRIEPFGMDECWLDLTGCVKTEDGGLSAAEKIRETVRNELGITVSIGVSFNKVFAKLGSDMRKPDMVTPIGEDDFREKIWPLPASDMIYVGRATEKKLAKYGITTIRNIAEASPDFLTRLLGVNGQRLWTCASGLDRSRVMHVDFAVPIKSIGHGITCTSDLVDAGEVWKVMLELSQDIGHKLRLNGFCAGGVQITVKDNDLFYKQYQEKLQIATQSPMEIAVKALDIFKRNYDEHKPVRAVTVRAINLVSRSLPEQLCMFDDPFLRRRREDLESAVESIRSRFGKRAIYSASLMGDIKMPGSGINEVILPGLMYR
jgi:DNA polymerase-4